MFKKIASVFASAVMLGSTMGVALAANYPAPFVSGGSANAAIVYGSNAAATDLGAAINIQTNLNSRVTSTSGTTATASGDGAVNLATSSQRVYINDSLNVARTVLTKDHLPTLLADGSAYDNAGTEYKYTQTVVPGQTARKVAFSKSSESIDPALMIDLGYQGKSGPVYNYTLTFSKALNVTNTDVIGTAEISLLGKEYTIGANSDGDTLYLYGSGETTSVDEGETATVTVDGKDHSLTLVGTSSTTAATIEVDGTSRSVTKGNSYKFADGFEIYFKDLFHATKTGTLSRVELLVGSQTLHLQDGQAVRIGADDTTILGTNAEITAGSVAGGDITKIEISQAAESSLGDYLKAGQVYTDRVFDNLVLDFAGAIPSLESDTRDSIHIDTDNAVAARATFTTAHAEGEEYTLTYARDSDNTANTALARIDLAYDNDLNISVQENDTVRVNQYLMANDNDEGRILQVVSIGAGTNTNDYTLVRDVITGVDYRFETGVTNKTTSPKSIGGAQYYIHTDPSNADSAIWTAQITWGAGASAADFGTQRTLFPRIKLANGEWIAFLTQTTVANGTTFSLPGQFLLSDYKSGSVLTPSLLNNSDTVTSYGNIGYNVSWGENSSTGSTSGTLDTVQLGGVDCIFNTTSGPAILIMEEKTLDDSNGHGICIPLATQGTNPKMPAIGGPIFSDGYVVSNSLVTLQSNTYKSQAVDRYGTWVERDTSSGTNYAVTIKYPDEQMYADVFFRAAGVEVTPGSEGSSGSGNVVIVKDTEVSSVQDRNLIVIGGSCVNTVARRLVDPDATSPICGADFTAQTSVGAGQYLLKSMESPYNSDRIAMLVAGYEAPQTVTAAEKLKEGHATDVGTSNIYPVLS